MSIFNFTLNGGDADPPAEDSAPAAPTLSGNASGGPALTMEMIRAKRMNKYAKKSDNNAATGTEQSATAGESTGVKVAAVSDNTVANADNDANKEGGNNNEKSDNNLKTTAGAISIDTTIEKSPEKVASAPTTPGNLAGNSNSNSKNSSTTSLTSPTRGNTPSRAVHALNNALENVFLFTLNREHTVTTDGIPITFVGDDDSLEKRMITRNNLTELVMSMLVSDATPSCVNYLIATYKRILIKETTVQKEVRDDFVGCKTECISFLATCLGEPSTFSGSENSLPDFMQILMDDNTPPFVKLVGDLSTELVAQNSHEEVTKALIDSCYEALNVNNAQATMNPMMMMQMMNRPPIYSILENVQGPIAALQKLAASDKRIATLIAKHAQFLLDSAVLTALPASNNQNQLANIFGFGAAPPVQIGGQGPSIVQGAAIADMTILGRMMRYIPDIRDEAMSREFGEIHRSTQSQVEGVVNMVRSRINSNQQSIYSILMTLLKGGPEAKESALQFLHQCIIGNAENEKDQPSPKIAASRGFMLNLSGILLRLSKPIFAKIDMLKKIEWQFLIRKESEKTMPRDATGLRTNNVTLPAPESIDESKNASFLTLCLFMCCRSLHLSLSPMCREYKHLIMHLSRAQEDIQNGEPRALQLLLHKFVSESELLNPELLDGVVNYCTSMAFVLMTALRTAGDDISNTKAEEVSFLEPSQMSSGQITIINAIPEYLIDDVLTMLLFVAKTRPDLLGSASMNEVLGMIIFFLRRPNCIQSPHIKAKFSEVLYQVFLPNAEREAGLYNERYVNKRYPDTLQASMLESDPLSQKYLAPALLLLYGDVERTGEYEKVNHRRRIMVILNYLWSVQAHRPAFRGIAQGDADASIAVVSDSTASTATSVTGATAATDGTNATTASDSTAMDTECDNDTEAAAGGTTYFVRFANGLLNGTNKLVHETLSGLNEIKTIQDMMKRSEWNTMTAEQKEEKEEKLRESQDTVRANAGLCLETLHMVNYLTSDAVIVGPFLLDEIRPRFASMILSILHNITGKKSTDIKVDDFESLHFKPADMLKEVCQILLHVAPFPSIYDSLVMDAFWNPNTTGESTLTKAIATVRKLSLLNKQELESLVSFEQKLVAAAQTALDADLDNDLPNELEHYRDIVMDTIMTDPVLLPTSDTILDRSTITQCLLNDSRDPINREPLTIDQVIPQPELKSEIEQWRASKLAEKKLAREMLAAQVATEGAGEKA